MEFFEERLLGSTFIVFRGRATVDVIRRFSITGYWGGHLVVFDNRKLGGTFGCFREQATWEDIWMFSRTGYWGGHMELMENRLMGITFEIFFREQAFGRTFGVFRIQVTG